MSYNGTIPEHDRNLRIHDETTRDEIVGFLESRLSEPAEMGDVVVFNFSSYDFDARALINASNDLDPGIYVIPYQVSGVWGFMVDALPAQVADAPLLNYRTSDGEYRPYVNHRNDITRDERRRLASILSFEIVHGGDQE